MEVDLYATNSAMVVIADADRALGQNRLCNVSSAILSLLDPYQTIV